jgi:carboxyl-terminal processing protease
VPKRNAILLLVVCLCCAAAYVAREQSAAGRRFGEVLALIQASYFERVDGDELFDAAVDAAMARLDEHSAFIRGDGRADLEAVLDQRFAGVGLELSIDDSIGMPVVASPVIDSPAWRAGLRSGDRIEAIDGASTVGLSLHDVVGRLRGRLGERVALQVVSHAGVDVPTLDPAAEAAAISRREVILKREVIKTESVFGDRRRPDGGWDWMIEGVAGVAYAHIAVFGEQTAKELATAIDDMVARGEVRALVLDVRGNPGGLLAAAVEVCDLFLDEGVIVQTRGRRDAGTGETATSELRRATVGQRLAGVPMVVLIDGLTASAAEIVAACLQDSGRATICGSRTFGKGTVQSILPLSDDRGLIRLTTSEYVRPSRANIHRRVGDGDHAEWGVTPDAGFELTPTAESNARLAVWRRARHALGGLPTSGGRSVPTDLPCDIDPVLALGIREFSAARTPSGQSAPDLGGQEETSRDDDHALRPDA